MTWKTRLLVFYLTVIGLYQGLLVTIRVDALDLVSRGPNSVIHYIWLLLISTAILTLMASAVLALILLRHRFAALAVSGLMGSMTVLYLAQALYWPLIRQVFVSRVIDTGVIAALCLMQWGLWQFWGRRYFGFAARK